MTTTNSLQPHQQRVVDEVSELDTRIEKLINFVESDRVDAVEENERLLMGAQLLAMQTYSFCLKARIRGWYKPSDN